jgi:hypothetical protein
MVSPVGVVLAELKKSATVSCFDELHAAKVSARSAKINIFFIRSFNLRTSA